MNHPTVQRISKFLRVVSEDSMRNERRVMSNDNKLIAIIGYYKPWREWALYPQPNTVWSTDCLLAIKSHLAWMNKVAQSPEPSRSPCCNAPVRVARVGTTHWHECVACGKACDPKTTTL